MLIGNGGDDWLYASHGTNSVVGGEGRDTIWSYFAVRVTIKAGAGNDKVWVKNGPAASTAAPAATSCTSR